MPPNPSDVYDGTQREADYQALRDGIVAELDRLGVEPGMTVATLLTLALNIYARVHECSFDSAACRLGDHLYQTVGQYPEARVPQPANDLSEQFRRHVLHQWFHGEFRDKLADETFVRNNLHHVLAVGLRDGAPPERAVPIAVGAFIASVIGIFPYCGAAADQIGEGHGSTEARRT